LADLSVDDYEPLVSDWRLSVVEGRLRETYSTVPFETEFATFIQPPKYLKRGPGDEGWLPAMAVFIVRSPHPTNPRSPGILTHGTVEKRHFDQSERERKHFVSLKEDPVLTIFSVVLRNHLTTLSNLRSIIH
jgi:hypothetical protein